MTPSSLNPISDNTEIDTLSQSKGLSPKLLLKVGLSLILLVFVFQYTGLEGTLRKLSTANLWFVPVGIALYLFAQLISAYRWQFLSAPLGFNFGLIRFYNIYLIGMFFNLFLPGAIGGDMLRMVYLARNANKKKREALLTLLAERGVGLVALMILTSVVCLTPSMQALSLSIPLQLPFSQHAPYSVDLRLVLFALSSFLLLAYVGLWVIPLDKLVTRLPQVSLLLQAKVYWANIPMLCKSVCISVMVHSMMILMHLLIATALDVQVPVLFMAIVYGIVSLASVLPIAFNGFGVREGVYVLLLTKVGLTPETALAFALYWVIISTITSLLGGMVLLQGKYSKSASSVI